MYMTGIPRFVEYESELRDQYGDPGSTIFTVSGLTGTGTTTVATVLCDRFDLDHVNAGEFFRNLADEFDMSLQEFDGRTEAIEEREDRDFDLEWDRTALKYAFTRDNFILEGRLAGVLLKDIAPVRIKVTCDPAVIAERVHSREDMSVAAAKEYVQTRNQEVLARYREKYGVNPRKDDHYNLVIDNSDSFDAVKDTLFNRIQAIRNR
jgi:cytidylate kinase